MPASALMNVMIGAARKAGRSLARDFGEVEHLQVSVKGPSNFVTRCGFAGRRDHLRRAHQSPARLWLPHGRTRGEVKGADGTHRWIVDPLDGTTNFLHSIPNLRGLPSGWSGRVELVAGLIYNPVDERDLHRREGPGRLSQRPPHPGRRPGRTSNTSVIGTGVPHSGRPGP